MDLVDPQETEEDEISPRPEGTHRGGPVAR